MLKQTQTNQLQNQPVRTSYTDHSALHVIYNRCGLTYDENQSNYIFKHDN